MLFGVIWADGITPKRIFDDSFNGTQFASEKESEANTFKQTMQGRFEECKYEVVVLEDH